VKKHPPQKKGYREEHSCLGKVTMNLVIFLRNEKTVLLWKRRRGGGKKMYTFPQKKKGTERSPRVVREMTGQEEKGGEGKKIHLSLTGQIEERKRGGME